MGTRSAIGVQLEDGSVRAVYCHWDGYPEYNGKILWDHYDHDKTMKLMALGDLSSLGTGIGEKHDFGEHDRGQCTFYARDRGETGVDARTYEDEEAFFDEFDMGVEYWYLLVDGVWHVRGYQQDNWELVSCVLDKVAA